VHLRSSFAIIKKISQQDWLAQLEEKNNSWPIPWQEIYHLVILPMYKESYGVVAETFESLLSVNYPKEKIIVVLAVEKRAGTGAQAVAGKIEKHFGGQFFKFLIITHPDDIIGELAGKGSNETWAAREVKEKILPYVNAVESSIEKMHFLKKISDTTGIPEEALKDDLKKVEQELKFEQIAEEKVVPSQVFRKDYIEKRLLGIVLWQKTLLEQKIDAEKILKKGRNEF